MNNLLILLYSDPVKNIFHSKYIFCFVLKYIFWPQQYIAIYFLGEPKIK